MMSALHPERTYYSGKTHLEPSGVGEETYTQGDEAAEWGSVSMSIATCTSNIKDLHG